jgi:PAS domain S-box-containing protein
MANQEILDLIRQFVLNASDAIVLTDANDRIVLWNRGAEDMFGHAAEAMVGRPLSTLIPTALVEDGEPQRMSERVAL